MPIARGENRSRGLATRPRPGRRLVATALVVAVGAFVAGPVRPAAGGTAGITLRYDVYYLAMRILEVESTTLLDDVDYRMTSSMRSVGLVGFLFPWESRSRTRGAVAGGILSPATYDVDSVFRGRTLQVGLRYTDGTPVVAHNGGEASTHRREPVAEAERPGTVDPLTAAIAVSHGIARDGHCEGVQRVFDGVRRYDLRYRDLGTTELPSSGRDKFSGSARRCHATVEPIGGFLRRGEGSGEAPTGITAWMLSPLPGAATVPVRLDFEGARGTLHAHLTSASPAETEIRGRSPSDAG